jgi:regulator of protease activity HflC (stomatin/prohibitin superfamily)
MILEVSGVVLLILLFMSLKLVNPTERGLVERFGKYNRFAEPGLNIIIPFIEGVRMINITEQMIDAEPQEVITKDNLNAQVDAQIYFKVVSGEDSVKKSQYNVYDYEEQIVALARTTLRNIIGQMNFVEVNSQRDTLNNELAKGLRGQIHAWGIEIVRAELKEIQPPKDVQETMNKVLKAQNEKTAAIDYATATETQADGKRRALIKEAEGYKQSSILKAEGEAKAIELVNTAAREYFKDEAQLLKRLEVTENALKNNAKVIVPSGSNLVNVIGDLGGMPIMMPQKQEPKAENTKPGYDLPSKKQGKPPESA